MFLFALLFAAFCSAQSGYRVYCVGNCSKKVKTNPLGGLLMAGGSTDVDAGMKWMIDQSGKGDFLILRASGADGYNQYLLDLGSPNSVTTIVTYDRASASAQEVIDIINEAEAIFFAGGDQSLYVKYWQNTPTSVALQQAVTRGVVFGGTSAGLAIQGQYIYTGEKCSVTSSEALANPYNNCMTFATEIIDLPYMKGVLTDSHFAQRDRMGRLVTFLAREVTDNSLTRAPYGIGVDEETNIAIQSDGIAMMFGDYNAYIITYAGIPTTCEKNKPLTYRGIQLLRMSARAGDTFNFVTMKGTGVTYGFDVQNGVIVGSPYGPAQVFTFPSPYLANGTELDGM